MDCRLHHRLFVLLILISFSPKCQSWGWFFSSSEKHASSENSGPESFQISKGYGGSFSVEGYDDRKGSKSLEKAKSKMDGSNFCWKNAYRNLFAGCSEIFANEEKRSRFAWQLADCFQKDTGRPSFPSCDMKSPMQKCLQQIDQNEHKIYLEFYLETNTICHQLQASVFKHETERLVNDLKNSAQYAEEKLEIMEERSEQLLHSSSEIHSSLSSVDSQTQQISLQAKDVQVHLFDLLNNSQALYEKFLTIATTQSELHKGQDEMKEKIVEGMDTIKESYSNLGQEIESLKSEAVEIEKEISKVGDEMSLRMTTLQTKAEDIGNMAGISLDRQKELLDGQGKALDGIQYLSKFQSQALEESRNALQQLAEYSSKQQEELLRRQEQLQQVHDHLVKNSKAILAAQEAFEVKQASMLIALDKLFALVNALLVESRMINALLFYIGLTFVIHVVTSTKPVYLRPRLFIGVWATFFIEIAVLWFMTKQQTWMQTMIIKSVRSTFLLLASLQYLHAIYTYRDYETLNHQMLQTLIEKVNYMHATRELDGDEDSDVDWSLWIDTELSEDVDSLQDPDYLLPEEVGGNLLPRKYDLRRRYF